MFRKAPLAGLALILLMAAGGCREAQVTSYRVKKDPEPAAPPPAASPATAPAPAPGGSMASTPVATAEGAELAWTAPAAWTAKAGSAMRRGTYIIKGSGSGEAELAITAFPGDVGGDLANVNRWRGQIGLPPLVAADLESALTRMTTNGLPVAVVDLTGGSQRILGAIVPFSGSTWFFKLTGPDAVVAEVKPAFLSYLQTLRAK